MARTALLLLLALVLLEEVVFVIAGFAAPGWTLRQFQISSSGPDALFLVHCMTWMLVLVTLIIALAFYWLLVGNDSGRALVFVLGGWWIVFGIALFVLFGRTESLVLDSTAGTLAVLLNVRARWRATE